MILEAGVVEQLGVEFDVREVLGDVASGAEEETVAHLHDRCFMHDADFGLADVARVLEGVA